MGLDGVERGVRRVQEPNQVGQQRSGDVEEDQQQVEGAGGDHRVRLRLRMASLAVDLLQGGDAGQFYSASVPLRSDGHGNHD